MNKYTATEIDKMLKSIGKSFFVKYFESFMKNDYSSCFQKENYSEKATKTRVSNSRRIFEQGQQFDALENIINSDRVSYEQRCKAQDMIKKYKLT